MISAIAKMKIPKLDKPATVFLAFTVVSVGFLVYPMWNYTKYYMALWNFDYTVLSLSIDLNQANMPITINMLFTNPVDYSGLELVSITIGLEYVNPAQSHLVWDPTLPGHWGGGWRESNVWELKSEIFSLRLPLRAFANETVPLTIYVNPYAGTDREKENAMTFIGFLSSRPDKIQWGLSCYLALSTFLGGYTVNRYFPYETTMTYP